jgi:hypothetical protein
LQPRSEPVLTKEDTLKLIVEHLDKKPFTSFGDIRATVKNSLRQRGLIGKVSEHIGGGTTSYFRDISDEDSLLINDCIYDLLYKRVITPGINDENLELPWIHVSNKEKLKTYL